MAEGILDNGRVGDDVTIWTYAADAFDGQRVRVRVEKCDE